MWSYSTSLPRSRSRSRSTGASRRAASACRTSVAVSSSVAGSGSTSSPYSCARSSSSYTGRPGSIRYAASIVSSAGVIVSRGSDLKSCAITCASRRRAWATSASNWPSTTPSSRASAKRPSSTASDARSRVSGSSPSRHVTPVPSGRIVGSAGTASSSWSTRPIRLRNSKRRNISFSCERSGGCRTSSAGSDPEPRSRSRRIVASSFDTRACSACSWMFLRARA